MANNNEMILLPVNEPTLGTKRCVEAGGGGGDVLSLDQDASVCTLNAPHAAVLARCFTLQQEPDPDILGAE